MLVDLIEFHYSFARVEFCVLQPPLTVSSDCFLVGLQGRPPSATHPKVIFLIATKGVDATNRAQLQIRAIMDDLRLGLAAEAAAATANAATAAAAASGDASATESNQPQAPSAVVLWLQNGLYSARLRYPFMQSFIKPNSPFPVTALLGLTYLAAFNPHPGIVNQNSRGVTKIIAVESDRLSGPATAVAAGVASLQSLLSNADLAVEVVRSDREARAARFGKLFANAIINVLTAVLKCNNGVLATDPSARQMVAIMHAELLPVFTIMVHTGLDPELDAAPIPLPTVEDILQVAVDTSGNRSSTMVDVSRGRRTEVIDLLAEVLKKAEIADLKIPITTSLYNQIVLTQDGFQRAAAKPSGRDRKSNGRV